MRRTGERIRWMWVLAVIFMVVIPMLLSPSARGGMERQGEVSFRQAETVAQEIVVDSCPRCGAVAPYYSHFSASLKDIMGVSIAGAHIGSGCSGASLQAFEMASAIIRDIDSKYCSACGFMRVSLAPATLGIKYDPGTGEFNIMQKGGGI